MQSKFKIKFTMIRFTFLLLLVFACEIAQAQVIMFPGDANNDGVANHYDILPVGVAYGSEGFLRPGASPNWQPQFQPNSWPQNLPVSGVNLAFVDSDGNGLIDSLDIDAIALNFDSTQILSQPPPHPYLLEDTCFSCAKPLLAITFDRDTAMVKDTFYALLELRYPPNVPPPAGALGLAFDLSYTFDNVKDSLTKVYPDTMPGDLMFVTATQTLAKSWRAVPPGKIGFGAAAKGQNALFINRQIGAVEIVVEDLIIRSVADQFWMDASNVLIVNELEQVVGLGGILVDTIVLFDPASHVAEPDEWAAGISVFPNPTREAVSIQSPLAPVLALAVYGMTGQALRSEKMAPTQTASFDVGQLSSGLYFLKISTTAGVAVKKIQVK